MRHFRRINNDIDHDKQWEYMLDRDKPSNQNPIFTEGR